MSPAERQADDFARDVERERIRCPRAAKLMDTITHALTYEIPAFPERGSRAWELRKLIEMFSEAVGTDLEYGIEATSEDEAYVNEKIREARS